MEKDFNRFINSRTMQLLGYDELINEDKIEQNYSEVGGDTGMFDELTELAQDYDNLYNNLEGFIKKYPAFKTYMPIFYATRKKKLFDSETRQYIRLTQKTDFETVERILRASPLDRLLRDGKISDIGSYVVGIEEGMNTNARKNSTGTKMENITQQYFEQQEAAGFISNLEIQYDNKKLLTEGLLTEEEMDRLADKDDAFDIGDADGKEDSTKRSDFKFQIGEEIYLVEVNFYGTTGSKPYEVARSYRELNEEINNIPHLHFIWVTDGEGWNSKAKDKRSVIERAYREIQFVFNLNELFGHNIEELLN